MNTKKLVLPLLLVVLGCRDRPNPELVSPGSMLSRERICQIAEEWVRKTDHLKEEDKLAVSYDDGNREWLSFLKESEQDEPEASQFYHKMLKGRDYQAVFIGDDPPSMGGTYFLLIGRRTGEVITFAAGV